MEKMKRFLEEREKVLTKQLELISEDSKNAMGKELESLTKSMCVVLRELSITYLLRGGIIFVVFPYLLISFVVLIKKLLWSKRR